jgi:hypothetical protein
MPRLTFTGVLFQRMRGHIFMKKCGGMNSNIKNVCHPTEMEI